LIGEKIFDRRVGLVASLLFSLSGYLILNNISIGAVNFGAPLFWFSYWIFLISLKKKKISIFIISFIILLLASTITYSAIIFIPYYLICMFYTYKYTLKAILFSLSLSLLAVGIAYSPLLYVFNAQTLFTLLSPQNTLTFSFYLPIKLIDNFILLVSAFFQGKKTYALFVSLVASFLLIRSNFKKQIIYTISPILYVLLFLSLKSGPIFPWWSLISAPFIYISLGIGIIFLFQIKPRFFMVVPIIVLVVFLFQEHGDCTWGNNSTYVKQAAQEILVASRLIKFQEGYREDNFYKIIVSTPMEDNWHTTPVLYWLEVLTNSRYIKLVNFGESIEQTYNDDYIFWLCKDYENEQQDKQCFNKYIQGKNQYQLVDIMPIKAPTYFGYILKKVK
jgi:hypothetical protein